MDGRMAAQQPKKKQRIIMEVKQRLDKNTKKYRLKCRGIMLRLRVEASKRQNPVVSYDDLLLPFQDYHCLDLREKGLVILGTDHYGRPGVALNRIYRDLDPIAFKDVLDGCIGKAL